MKKTGTLGFFCMLAILGIVLIGNQMARGGEPQAQPTGTNLVSVSGTSGSSGNTLPADINPGSAFAELVRLVQAGVEESVILAYIDNTLRLFNLDADDIIYLADLGAPAGIIEAAMEHDQQLIQKGISPSDTAPPDAAAEDVGEPPEEEVTVDEFHDTLSPYGAWVNIEGYGRCWRPTVVVYNTGWHPYCDNGHWVYTDHGWYWRSNYSWGWATFHYGRWFNHSRYGWCWWPDTVWAPSWVCWRYDRSYCGWAPLPPYTVYRPGFGFVYRGSTVVVGFNFGLSVNSFTFVSIQNFYDPKPWRHRIGHGEAKRIYDRTTVFNKINHDRKSRRITNPGIPHRDISAATRKEIRPVSIHHAKGRVARGKQRERLDQDGRTLIVDRPSRVSPRKTTPSTTRRNVQQPGRTKKQGGTSTARNGGQNNNRKPSETKNPDRNPNRSTPQAPQSPQVQRKQSPRPAPRPQERKSTVTPPKNKSNNPTRKPPQKKRSNPPPKVKQPRKAKTPPPSAPPRAKKKGQNKNTGQ